MGIFDTIGSGQVFGSSRPFAHGLHRVSVKAITHHKGKGQKVTDWFIVEATVLQSEAHEAGTERSWVVDLGQASGPGNAKGFLLALGQCVDPTLTAESLTSAEWAALAERLTKEAATPAAGTVLSVEVFPVQTRKGNDFSKHVWSAVPGQALAFTVRGGTPPAPVAPPPPSAAPVNPQLLDTVRQWRAGGHGDDAIRSSLGAWAAQFGAGALDAAIKAA